MTSPASPPAPGASARFWRKVVIDLTVMGVVGLVLGLIGPFGSFADPLAQRLLYWLGVCYAGYLCYRPIGYAVVRTGERLDLPHWGLWTMACLIATVPMTAVIWSVGFLGRTWRLPRLDEALGTYVMVLLVGGGITAIFHLLDRRRQGEPAAAPAFAPAAAVVAPSLPAPAPVAAPSFLDRLPAELGSDLVALEMEDHYVRAHTALGSALVLMRLRDALAELGGIEGLQVHRSWWVARHAVEAVRREGRNVVLVLPRGLAAPVSRANVQVLKDAGWI